MQLAGRNRPIESGEMLDDSSSPSLELALDRRLKFVSVARPKIWPHRDEKSISDSAKDVERPSACYCNQRSRLDLVLIDRELLAV